LITTPLNALRSNLENAKVPNIMDHYVNVTNRTPTKSHYITAF